MSAYASTLNALQQAMLEAAPKHILHELDARRPALEARMNVYIEGYRTRLVQAVLADYPTLAHYLGEAEVRRLAKAYVDSTPSTSYTLDVYPLAFAAYVAQHADGFAAAIAALESAIAETFWLPESEAFVPSAELTPEALMELRLTPRAAGRSLTLDYPAEAYLVAVREGAQPTPPTTAPNPMFIVRHENEVKRHVLDPTEYKLLAAIGAGQPVGAALETVAPEELAHVATHLQSWLARWMTGGFFRKS